MSVLRSFRRRPRDQGARSAGVVATIEDEGDESVDRPVVAALQAAVQRVASPELTGTVARVEMIAANLLAPRYTELAHLGDLRYRLLTGVAGTLAWARENGGSRVVFVIHDIVTDQTLDDEHA